MLDFILGGIIGLVIFWFGIYAVMNIIHFLKPSPRCERGEKCGCQTVTHGCSSYRLCESKPPRYYD